jgi:hypothetical protein
VKLEEEYKRLKVVDKRRQQAKQVSPTCHNPQQY